MRIPLTVAAEVEDAGSTAVMVEALQAVAFISDARPRRPTEDLVAMRIVNPVPRVGVRAVWRPDSQPAVGAFLTSLEAAAPFPPQLGERTVRVPAQGSEVERGAAGPGDEDRDA